MNHLREVLKEVLTGWNATAVMAKDEGATEANGSKSVRAAWRNREQIIANLQTGLTLANDLDMGTLAYLIERALEEAQAAQLAVLVPHQATLGERSSMPEGEPPVCRSSCGTPPSGPSRQ